MKGKSLNHPIFIPYDDENLEHVSAGADYGQPESGSKKTYWTELDSKEFPDLVVEISEKILKNPFLKLLLLNSKY